MFFFDSVYVFVFNFVCILSTLYNITSKHLLASRILNYEEIKHVVSININVIAYSKKLLLTLLHLSVTSEFYVLISNVGFRTCSEEACRACQRKFQKTRYLLPLFGPSFEV